MAHSSGIEIMMESSDVRKAAVLVASLDRDTADALLDQLRDDQSQTIRDAILSMPQALACTPLPT